MILLMQRHNKFSVSAVSDPKATLFEVHKNKIILVHILAFWYSSLASLWKRKPQVEKSNLSILGSSDRKIHKEKLCKLFLSGSYLILLSSWQKQILSLSTQIYQVTLLYVQMVSAFREASASSYSLLSNYDKSSTAL